MPEWMETLDEIPLDETDQIFTIYTNQPDEDDVYGYMVMNAEDDVDSAEVYRSISTEDILSEGDEGKAVLNDEDKTIGRVAEVSDEAAQIDFEDSDGLSALVEALPEREADTDDYNFSPVDVELVSDDEVRLTSASSGFEPARIVRRPQGDLRLGKWYRETLSENQVEGRSFHLIEFGFSIRPFSDTRYKKAQVEIMLDDYDWVAKDLIPRNTYQLIDETVEFGVGASLTFETPINPSLEYKTTKSYPHLHPVIEAGDFGTNEFGWSFLREEGSPDLARGSQVMRIILDVPEEVSIVSGTAHLNCATRGFTFNPPPPIVFDFEWDLTKPTGHWEKSASN